MIEEAKELKFPQAYIRNTDSNLKVIILVVVKIKLWIKKKIKQFYNKQIILIQTLINQLLKHDPRERISAENLWKDLKFLMKRNKRVVVVSSKPSIEKNCSTSDEQQATLIVKHFKNIETKEKKSNIVNVNIEACVEQHGTDESCVW